MTTLVLLAYAEILTAPCWKNDRTYLIDRTTMVVLCPVLGRSYSNGLYIDIGHAKKLRRVSSLRTIAASHQMQY
ncbi:hypothetical protein ALC62_11586 [Cyphomyrmex costatus]|uniref:Uncharacterized protein n=1 Tax=Cyphomyrmex costatus TaxID=456900 RepID=A0A151ICC0_9HYME|nr:hypothetical protein ALC62_11586 [Cyphomyrmex costatus]